MPQSRIAKPQKEEMFPSSAEVYKKELKHLTTQAQSRVAKNIVKKSRLKLNRVGMPPIGHG